MSTTRVGGPGGLAVLDETGTIPTQLLDAAGLAAAHTHSGATTTYAPGSFTVATGSYSVMVDELRLTGVQEATLQGTAVLRIT